LEGGLFGGSVLLAVYCPCDYCHRRDDKTVRYPDILIFTVTGKLLLFYLTGTRGHPVHPIVTPTGNMTVRVTERR